MDSQQKKSAEQFAPQAEKYARAISFQGGPDLEFALNSIVPKSAWKMLDIATGGGHASFFFSPHVGSIIATDLTQEMIDAAGRGASERGLNNISFQTAVAEDLPFEDSLFDFVVCRIAPHHFSSIEAFIYEAARVLKTEGIFLVIDGISPENEVGSTLYNQWERTRDPSHSRCLCSSEWKTKIAEAGFSYLADAVVFRSHEFDDYMDRMSVPAYVKEKLKSDLLLCPEIRAWLSPEEKDGKLIFKVRNGVYVHRKR